MSALDRIPERQRIRCIRHNSRRRALVDFDDDEFANRRAGCPDLVYFAWQIVKPFVEFRIPVRDEDVARLYITVPTDIDVNDGAFRGNSAIQVTEVTGANTGNLAGGIERGAPVQHDVLGSDDHAADAAVRRHQRIKRPRSWRLRNNQTLKWQNDIPRIHSIRATVRHACQ